MSSPVTQLAIDIGNSSVKALCFRNGQPVHPVERFAYDEWAVADRLVTNLGVQNIIYSTVANVPPAQRIENWKASGRLVLPLTADTPLPFRSDYGTMATLGHDRRAGIAGCRVYERGAALLVDAGSCVTLDLIDADGIHRGGNISPGIRMRLRAMHEQTQRLPLVDPEPLSGAVGRSTADALRHGAQRATVYEIEGLFARLLPDHPGLRVVLTGGDGAYLAEQLSVPRVFHPDLVLLGLNQILSDYVAKK